MKLAKIQLAAQTTLVLALHGAGIDIEVWGEPAGSSWEDAGYQSIQSILYTMKRHELVRAGEIKRLVGGDIAADIIEHCQKHNITKLHNPEIATYYTAENSSVTLSGCVYFLSEVAA